MVSEEYKIAYAEVVEILNHIPYKDYKKIPNEMLEVFEENASTDFEFKYNPELSLDEQKVSKTTKLIIAILFRDFWANEEQKRKIVGYERYAEEKYQEELNLKYNTENIFGKNNDNGKEQENLSLTNVKEHNKWYNKIFKIFKKLFKKA